MRLLASNHWFADGNKRTALNATELFYIINGYELDYEEDLRSMLKLFSVRERLIDPAEGSEYFGDRTTPLDHEQADPWDAIRSTVLGALLEWSEVDPEELVPDDHDTTVRRRDLGLTTDYDGTINSDDQRTPDNDGG